MSAPDELPAPPADGPDDGGDDIEALDEAEIRAAVEALRVARGFGGDRYAGQGTRYRPGSGRYR